MVVGRELGVAQGRLELAAGEVGGARSGRSRSNSGASASASSIAGPSSPRAKPAVDRGRQQHGLLPRSSRVVPAAPRGVEVGERARDLAGAGARPARVTGREEARRSSRAEAGRGPPAASSHGRSLGTAPGRGRGMDGTATAVRAVQSGPERSGAVQAGQARPRKASSRALSDAPGGTGWGAAKRPAIGGLQDRGRRKSAARRPAPPGSPGQPVAPTSPAVAPPSPPGRRSRRGRLSRSRPPSRSTGTTSPGAGPVHAPSSAQAFSCSAATRPAAAGAEEPHVDRAARGLGEGVGARPPCARSRSASVQAAQGTPAERVVADVSEAGTGVARARSRSSTDPLVEHLQVTRRSVGGRPAGGRPAGVSGANVSKSRWSKNAVTCRTRSPSSSSTCSWKGTKSPAGVRAWKPGHAGWPFARVGSIGMSWTPPGHSLPIQPADVLSALEPAGERRHVPGRLGGEQADDRVDVLAPERVDITARGALLLGREVGVDGVLSEPAVGELGVRAAAPSSRRRWWCPGPRRPRRPTSAASRRISTARCRPGRCCRAATKAGRIEVALSDDHRRVGDGLEPHAISYFSSRASPAIASRVPSPAGGDRRGPPSGWSRHVGRDPGRARCAPTASGPQKLPPPSGAQEGLLHQVLGLLDRPDIRYAPAVALVALRQRQKSSSSLAREMIESPAGPVCVGEFYRPASTVPRLNRCGRCHPGAPLAIRRGALYAAGRRLAVGRHQHRVRRSGGSPPTSAALVGDAERAARRA